VCPSLSSISTEIIMTMQRRKEEFAFLRMLCKTRGPSILFLPHFLKLCRLRSILYQAILFNFLKRKTAQIWCGKETSRRR
jgi:hypothetical protein